MAHQLTKTAGRVEMAYVGETPWHGLGQNLPAGADIETWKKAAGMDWTIEQAIVHYTPFAGGAMRSMDDRIVLHRSDNGAPLSVVSGQYQPVQPGESLEFFRDLTADAGFQIETAGTLFGGKRLWALASIGEEARIADPSDKVKGYLLLCTACDGTMSTEARYTTIRVVCDNTLGFARAEGKASVKVSHRTTFDHATVKRDLGIEAARSRFRAAIEDFRQMAETRVSDTKILTATGRLLHPDWDDKSFAERTRLLGATKTPLYRIGELALDAKAIGSNLDGTQGTAWGWLNAVTEYVDHEAKARGQDQRLNSAWFGRGDQLKQRAQQMAVEMVGSDGRTIYVDQAVTVPEGGDADFASLLGKRSTVNA